MSTPTIPGSSPSQPTTPPQMPLGQEPPQPPPAQKPKKPLLKRVWFWVLVVIAAIVVVNVANGGTDTGTAPDAPAQTQEAEDAAGSGDTAGEDAAGEEVAGLGESVTIDDWSVVVTAVGEPVASVGGEYLSTEAQGVFVPVHIAVTNEGNEAQYFLADSFVLVDDQGREFSYSTEATVYGVADGAVSVLDEINPGNTIEGVIFYDVPADATIVSMTVSGGLFTSPVTIDLR